MNIKTMLTYKINEKVAFLTWNIISLEGKEVAITETKWKLDVLGICETKEARN